MFGPWGIYMPIAPRGRCRVRGDSLASICSGLRLVAAAWLLAWSGIASAQAAATASDLIEVAIPEFPRASVFRQKGGDTKPVVVILAGADGDDQAGRHFGPVLARQGYAAVSLPYYSPNWGEYGQPPAMPDLPGSFIDIRVDQLAELRAALSDLPGVDVSRFGLFGGSKGAEFALIAASRYDWIDSVVAYAPSDLVWEGWGLETVDNPGVHSSFSFEGEPLAFMPYRDFFSALDQGPNAALRPIHENGRADHPEKEAAARIPVENYRGSLLLVAGDMDQQWNSGRMARNIIATREAAGLKTEALIYPEAGHDLAGGSTELRDDPRGGGSPEANARARADSWPKVLAFMEQTLQR